MIHRAASAPPIVATAWPVGSGGLPRSRITRSRSASASGPAARVIAPSTPPPGRRAVFAAFTTASTSWNGDVSLHEHDPWHADIVVASRNDSRPARPVRCRPCRIFDILVLGDANPDLVLSGGDVVPAFGQAERLVDEARLVIGGSGAIFACGAAKLGLRVAFAGVVGDDMFGRFMCDQLQAHGIDTSAVAVLPERSTGVTVVLSGRDDRAMLTFAGTIGDLRRSVIGADVLSRTRHIHVSSYFLQRALAAGAAGAVPRGAGGRGDDVARSELGSIRRCGTTG